MTEKLSKNRFIVRLIALLLAGSILINIGDKTTTIQPRIQINVGSGNVMN